MARAARAGRKLRDIEFNFDACLHFENRIATVNRRSIAWTVSASRATPRALRGLHGKRKSAKANDKEWRNMAKRTPIKAIRAKCIECCGGVKTEPKRCEIEDCALWEYRTGHRPPKEIDSAVDNAGVGSHNQGI